MAKYTKRTVKDLSGYLKKVREIQGGHENLWFRGISRISYSLVPSLLRHSIAGSSGQQAIKELEEKINVSFKNRSIPYLGTGSSLDGWNLLFMMQHYRAPTRLLDWSESSLVGLHFATYSALSKDPDESAAVWVVDPDEWNNQNLRNMGHSKGTVSAYDSIAEGYKTDTVYSSPETPPLAIYGALNNPRISMQKGAFTVFGPTTRPLENYSDNLDGNHILHRIEIPADRIKGIAKELVDTGITETSIYPDLEGLSKELKRKHGF